MQTATNSTDTGTTRDNPHLSGCQIAAICAGNGVDFYDFVVNAVFAAQIGRSFFPSDRPRISLLAPLATFEVGLATRRLEPLAIGRSADRAGLRSAMLLLFSLVGLLVASSR